MISLANLLLPSLGRIPCRSMIQMMSRWLSSSRTLQEPMIYTQYSPCGQIATVEFNRPPVNSFSMQFMEEIIRTLENIEKNNGCRGIIFTSVSHHANIKVRLSVPKAFHESVELYFYNYLF